MRTRRASVTTWRRFSGTFGPCRTHPVPNTSAIRHAASPPYPTIRHRRNVRCGRTPRSAPTHPCNPCTLFQGLLKKPPFQGKEGTPPSTGKPIPCPPLSGLLKKSYKGGMAVAGTTPPRACPALRGCPLVDSCHQDRHCYGIITPSLGRTVGFFNSPVRGKVE